jgi:hypothetical protein
MENHMERKITLVDSAREFLERREELYNMVANSPEYRALGVPYILMTS